MGCPSAPVIEGEVVTAGTPSWTARAWAVYASPVGSPASGGAEAIASEEAVWGSKHTFDVAKNLFKSAVAHAPPYDSELPDGLAAAGFVDSGCFSTADLVAPKGISISLLLVPSASAPSDTSFEVAASGPVISGTLNVDGDLFRDGTLVDSQFDSTYPKAGYVYDYQPPFDTAVGGNRHMILNFAENEAWANGVSLGAGSYSFVVKVSDGSNSTEQRIGFRVE